MPAPMRPNPAIPSCTSPLPSVAVMRLARGKSGKDAGSVRIRRIRTRLRTPHDAALQPPARAAAGGWGLSNVLNLIRTMGRPRSWRRQVARRLRADELPEAEVLARTGISSPVSSTIWTKRPIGAALVQLSGRVQVARPEPVRRHTARAGANRLHERVDSALVLIRGVDEGLDARSSPPARRQAIRRASPVVPRRDPHRCRGSGSCGRPTGRQAG